MASSLLPAALRPASLRPASLLVLALSVSSLGAWLCPALAKPFVRSLSLQGVNVVVASGEGSVHQLSVRPSRRGQALPVVRQEVDGQVVGAEMEDLNGDGLPELFICVQSAGSGSYGTVLAWSTPASCGLLPINLQDLGTSDTKGYRGHDQVAVVRTSLVRRSPI